jgi:hypothetical protein
VEARGIAANLSKCFHNAHDFSLLPTLGRTSALVTEWSQNWGHSAKLSCEKTADKAVVRSPEKAGLNVLHEARRSVVRLWSNSGALESFQ